MQLRVLVVSLDRLSRAGLAAVLDQQPGLTVVGQVLLTVVRESPVDEAAVPAIIEELHR